MYYEGPRLEVHEDDGLALWQKPGGGNRWSDEDIEEPCQGRKPDYSIILDAIECLVCGKSVGDNKGKTGVHSFMSDVTCARCHVKNNNKRWLLE